MTTLKIYVNVDHALLAKKLWKIHGGNTLQRTYVQELCFFPKKMFSQKVLLDLVKKMK